MSLFWRIFTLNAAVLVVALALLVFTPATVSTPVLPAEAVVLLAGLIAVLVANAAMPRAPAPMYRDLNEVQETTRDSLDEIRPAPARARDGAGAVPGHPGGDHERDQARPGATADHRAEPARGGDRAADQRRRVRYASGDRG